MTEIATYQNARDEVVALKQEVAALRQVQVQYNTATPLLLCLIDGDGCIFNRKLLMLGTEGGHQAASKLRQHIITHNGSSQDLLVNVFFNREGLGKTVKTHLGILPETFNAFILGFNTASPLMSMLDVGTGKEAADAKIREIMRIFVRYPHVGKIYFGGGHDNGYVPNLMTIQNEGHLNKIVLLQSYSQPAAGINALGLPTLENNGIFLAEKLSRKNPTTGSPGPGAAEPEPGGERNKTVKEAVPPPPPNPTKVLGGDTTEQNIPALKALKPRACYQYYLTQKGCPFGSTCHYGHAYQLSQDMLADLRKFAKQKACKSAIKGQECTDNECPLAHQCPQGLNCKRHKENKCRFSAPGAHELPALSVDGSDHETRYPVPSPILPNHMCNGPLPVTSRTSDPVQIGQHGRNKSQLEGLPTQNGLLDPTSMRQTPSLGGPSIFALVFEVVSLLVALLLRLMTT